MLVIIQKGGSSKNGWLLVRSVGQKDSNRGKGQWRKRIPKGMVKREGVTSWVGGYVEGGGGGGYVGGRGYVGGGVCLKNRSNLA